MSRFTALLIGDQSLLIQCAEIWLARGHAIAAVATRNADIRAWATGAGLTVVDSGPGLGDRAAGLSYDWLFSLAYLSLIPDHLLAAARLGGINFHDGPLPDYAGLNAPLWALINGEARHGVTWHKIEGGIDEGAVIEQRLFDIAEDETALTLNAKCFAAAIESFAPLLDQLERGGPLGRAQDLSKRRYFARKDRPEAAARLDFTQPADELARLVRALDHGGYWNPLACPKIETADGRVFVVGAASAADAADLSRAEATPGAVLAVPGDALLVGAWGGAVRLSKFTDMAGRAVSPANIAAPGELLADLGPERAEALSRAATAAAGDEGFWRRRLADLRPARTAQLAGPRPKRDAAPLARLALPFAADLSQARLLVLLGACAGRAIGGGVFDIAYRDRSLADAERRARGYVAPWAPLRIDCGEDGARSLEQAETLINRELAAIRGRAPFALDLPLRDPAILGVRTPDIAMCLGADVEGLGGARLILALDDRGAAFLYDQNDPAAAAEAARWADRLAVLAAAAEDAAHQATPLCALPILSAAERAEVLFAHNHTALDITPERCIHQFFEAAAAARPQDRALVFEDQSLSFSALEARANQAAHALRAAGVGPGVLVGLFVPRSLDLVVGALAIMKAGGAYVPMDPAYPAERLHWFLEDSAAPVVLTRSDIAEALPPYGGAVLAIDADPRIASAPATPVDSGVSPADLAYVIYTSGSTGRPKGVMLEHRQVANFFAGMDDRIAHEDGGVWLAVTSLSFDISVLELFWSLARGFTVVISGADSAVLSAPQAPAAPDQPMDFSLYFWGHDDGHSGGAASAPGRQKYALLLDSAKFADQHGFKAVWTPERHFHGFGGLYPNPSVTGAAVAAVTETLAVRAGSCVGPLHHPARIAEEWAVIDNLTNGRAGVAIASGWQPEDFVLRPENTPPDNKPAMAETIDAVRRLWRGEAVAFPTRSGEDQSVITQPRPVSAELPIWVTTAGNPDTWIQAGRLGANVLTHLLGQSIEEVGEKIALYHRALAEAGFQPKDFTVTLMLHSFVGTDRAAVRAAVREPMKAYLRSAAGLIKQYAWAFPAFKRPEGATTAFDLDLSAVSEAEMEAVLDFAFERYFESSGLFGTVEDCVARADELKRIGVGEIACLIDYGVPQDQVLAGLAPLAEVLRRLNAPAETGAGEAAAGDHSIAAQIRRHGVTHLQCTPSMARLLLSDPATRAALESVPNLMIGGEAVPGPLAKALRKPTGAEATVMYGPTETTIWSTTGPAAPGPGVCPIGAPIANTRLYVLDQSLQLVPIGAPGELFIAGAGVARGYLNRPELTAERFLPDPFVEAEPDGRPARMYRTGDLVRRGDGGRIDFLGRADLQVKIRGHRIELGEIEARLAAMPAVREAVVLAREDAPGDQRLVGYVTLADASASARDLRAALAAVLPEAMTPSHVLALDAFPLTPNKKIDRARLPAPGDAAPSAAPGPTAPLAGETEQRLAEIWARVLGVSAVGPGDNFFDIGGHSLLAIQAHREMAAAFAPKMLAVTDLFRFPVLSALAAHIDGGSDQAAPSQPAAPDAAQLSAMARRRAMRAGLPR